MGIVGGLTSEAANLGGYETFVSGEVLRYRCKEQLKWQNNRNSWWEYKRQLCKWISML